MKRTVAILAAFACFGLALIVTPGTSELTKDAAVSASGAVVITNRRCNVGSADCNFYNRVNGLVFACPTGSGLCSECEINGSWDTCVQATGQSCNWLGSGNECGALFLGACDVNEECAFLTPLGVCIDAPMCRTVPTG